MKIIILTTLLLLIAFVSAQTGGYPCGSYHCYGNQVCVNGYSCVTYPYNDVKLSTKFIGSWVDGSRGNKVYTQYDVTISNNSNKNVVYILIGTDSTFKLRDSSSLWNMVRLPSGDLVLPVYQTSINAHASYTFGFILEGSVPANLWIKAVNFA
eukprot:gene7509-9229_t